MAGSGASGGRGKAAQAARVARRAWPFVLAAYERWQALPDHKKDEYRRRARGVAGEGRKRLADARSRRGRGRGRP